MSSLKEGAVSDLSLYPQTQESQQLEYKTKCRAQGARRCPRGAQCLGIRQAGVPADGSRQPFQQAAALALDLEGRLLQGRGADPGGDALRTSR